MRGSTATLGQEVPPRRVEVERKKRAYMAAHAQLADVLRARGVDMSASPHTLTHTHTHTRAETAAPVDASPASAAPPPALHLSSPSPDSLRVIAALPLPAFDDAEHEVRDPWAWMALGEAPGGHAGHEDGRGQRGVPAQALDGGTWRACRAMAYDPATSLFTCVWTAPSSRTKMRTALEQALAAGREMEAATQALGGAEKAVIEGKTDPETKTEAAQDAGADASWVPQGLEPPPGIPVFGWIRVPRLSLCFMAEDPWNFAARLSSALRRRAAAAAIMRFHAHADCIPHDEALQVPDRVAARVQSVASAMTARGGTQRGAGAAAAAAAASANLSTTFLAGVQADLRRCMNVMLLARALQQATAVPRDASGAVPPSALPSYCALSAGGIPTDAGLLALAASVQAPAVIEAAVAAEEAAYPRSYLALPPTPPPPAYARRGLVDVPQHDFRGNADAFAFQFLYTRDEAISAVSRVLAENTKLWRPAGSGLLLSMSSKSSRVDEFEHAQNSAIASFSTFLKETWCANVKTHVRHCFGGVGKGHFNLKESNPKAYEFSKLRRFLRMLNYRMQDELRYVTDVMLLDFANFIESACAGTVEVVSSNTVNISGAPARRLPLFTVDLSVKELDEAALAAAMAAAAQTAAAAAAAATEAAAAAASAGGGKDDGGAGEGKGEGDDEEEAAEARPASPVKEPEPVVFRRVFTFSVPIPTLSAAPIAAFDKALRSISGMHQVERTVMDKLFWPEDPVISTVHPLEPHVVTLRDRIGACLTRACAPLQEYLQTFAAYLPFLNLDVEAFLTGLRTKFSTPGGFNLKEVYALITKHRTAAAAVLDEIPASINIGLVQVSATEVRTALARKHKELADGLLKLLAAYASDIANDVTRVYDGMVKAVSVQPTDIESLVAVREYMNGCPDKVREQVRRMDEASAIYEVLELSLYALPRELFDAMWRAEGGAARVNRKVSEVDTALEVAKGRYTEEMASDQAEFSEALTSLAEDVSNLSQYTSLDQVAVAAPVVARLRNAIDDADAKAKLFNTREGLFGKEITSYERLADIKKSFEPFQVLWETAANWIKWQKSWMSEPFTSLNAEALERDVGAASRNMARSVKAFERLGIDGCLIIAKRIRDDVEAFKPNIPLITALRNPGMRERHWTELSEAIGIKLDPEKEKDKFTLDTVLSLKLSAHLEVITKVGEKAGKEYQIELALEKMTREWEGVLLDVAPYRETGTYVLRGVDELQTLLDEHTTMTQAMAFSSFKKPFTDRIETWSETLNTVAEVLDEWMKVQRSWLYLQPIFDSPDIQKQLPTEYKRFSTVDKNWRATLLGAKGGSAATAQPCKAINYCANEKLLERFQESNKFLDLVQKGLSDYLETKRAAFARFYFLSNDELLEILSQTKDPRAVQPHMKKCFEGVKSVEFSAATGEIVAMISSEKERVAMVTPVDPKGKNVEVWMSEFEAAMVASVKACLLDSITDYPTVTRTTWVQKWPGQCVLNGSQLHWTREIEDGIRSSGAAGVQACYAQQLAQLRDMVVLIRSKLSPLARITLGALTVIDVHARDVTKRMSEANVGTLNDFEWISNLRYYWHGEGKSGDMNVQMVSSVRPYGYEYLGNSLRLVITPLTDKCYMTLMGALQMTLGGAPAGPAGTGKTETTKDLAKAVSRACVVFNCSDGLDYLAMGKFFKGLASCGAWACFDEFNRIDVEVLSVVAQQLLTLQDAVRSGVTRLTFEGSDISLNPNYAAFITMNPGYAGRTELPDNLKALFRPVAMMVPDYALIAEIMLFSFGFEHAQVCAAKMVATFKLCSEQLSSQDHYDYGMRAVKTVITAAGNLKSAHPDENEEVLLYRALQDVNVPKFLAPDLPLFRGIMSDLFPEITKPNVDYGDLEAALTLCAERAKLQPVPHFITKCIQIYETVVVRHGMMVVGPTGGGKSSMIRTARDGLSLLHARGKTGPKINKVLMYMLNPKSITMGQLYGEFDPNTHEWSDGILAGIVRECAKNASAELKWVVFDGPVDALWIENMNTVLDDNKKLCFSEDMQVLTSDGFMFLPQALQHWADGSNPDFFVAGFDPATESIVYERPLAMIVNPDEAQDMVEFSDSKDEYSHNADDNGISLVVTPEHAMYVRRGQLHNQASAGSLPAWSFAASGEYRKVTAGQIEAWDASGTERMQPAITFKAGARNGVLHAAEHAGDEQATNDVAGLIHAVLGVLPADFHLFLELYGYWCSEGSLVMLPEGDRGHVAFRAVSQHDIDWLVATLDTLGVSYNRTHTADAAGKVPALAPVVSAPHDTAEIHVADARWNTYFVAQYGHKGVDSALGSDGILFLSWVWQLSAEQARHVLNGLHNADRGDKASHAPRKSRTQMAIVMSCPRFRDQVVQLSLHAGFSPQICAGQLSSPHGSILCANAGWRVELTAPGRENYEPVLQLRPNTVKRVSYKGRTWCFTMPSGFLIARRAAVDANGVVTEASRPVVVGNCLTSGEIIALTDEMTIMFEVEDLAVASPATVSRCGMVYTEPASLGTDVLVQSWLESLPSFVTKTMKTTLQVLVDTHVRPALVFLRRHLVEPVPTVDNQLVRSMLNIIDCFLEPFVPREGRDAATAESLQRLADALPNVFLFAVTWSIAASTNAEGRKRLNAFLRHEIASHGWRAPPPETGMVYDFCFSVEENEWKPWMATVPAYEYPSRGADFSELIIPTKDSVRYKYLTRSLLTNRRAVLMTGPTGTGKTVNMSELLAVDMPKEYVPISLTFSAQTSANQTQDLVDGKLEKRQRGTYGPTAGSVYVLFVDDLNMPQKEVYGAQAPIELLRQMCDYGGWYDRKERSFRRIIDTVLLAAMGPPGGGRNPITARLVRHFNVISATPMDHESLHIIFDTILKNFVAAFAEPIRVMATSVVTSTIAVYDIVTERLLPTPSKPHYTFNLRDMGKVFQGMLMSDPKRVAGPAEFGRLWVHEMKRVFADRLVNEADTTWFEGVLRDAVKNEMKLSWDTVVPASRKRLLYGDYTVPGADPRVYAEVENVDSLQPTIEEYLSDYNAESKTPMKLVMFLDAIDHVSRIARVLRQPQGNALLLGVGGSGRQSLTRLAAFMSDFELFTIEITKGYGKTEWRDDVKRALMRAGIDEKPVVFLFNDTQIVFEGMLEDVNNVLNSGDVPNLYNPEDMDTIITTCRQECLKRRLPPTKINVFAQYLARVRRNIHVVLCMSPMGEAFRNRLRMFPAIINCCTIDWFSEWPEEALRSVAQSSLTETDMQLDTHLESVVDFFRSVHTAVATSSKKYAESLRRYNYVTPTSYLELLSTFKTVLKDKREKVDTLRTRLQTGLDKIISTEAIVSKLQEELVQMQPKLEATQAEVATMIQQLEKDRAQAAETKAVVEKDEAEAQAQAAATTAIAEDAKADLSKALPALEAAVECLDKLKKSDLDEVRSMKSPPRLVKLTLQAACIMFGIKPKIITSTDPETMGKKIKDYWSAAQVTLLADAKKLVQDLKDFDKDNIPDGTITEITPFIEDAEFTFESVDKASKACSGICLWVRAMHTYYHVAKAVEPKKAALQRAQEQLDRTMDALAIVKARLAAVLNKISDLEAKFADANARKEQLARDVALCAARLERARKLIGGLGGEKDRWSAQVQRLNADFTNLIGDALVSSSTIAYLGAFTAEFRRELVEGMQARLRALALPHTPGCTVLNTLADPVQVRAWNLAGLPTDTHSVENGIIMDNARRWPLMVDPQGQANRYVRNMGKDKSLAPNGLEVLRQSDKRFLQTLENCIRFGKWCLIENVGETLEAALEPVLLQQKFKQGGAWHIRLGDSVVPYADDFWLTLTTSLPNPHYAPEVQVKVSLLNFTITPKGLEDQLLGVFVVNELPELEDRKNALMLANARNRKELQDIENRILFLLSNSTGNILDDEELIDTLSSSKVKAEDISAQVKEAEATEHEIDTTRELYRPVAFRASILYFCITDLASVDPMYQYSLPWFTGLFVNSIKNSAPAEEVPQRITNLNGHFTSALYRNVCRSLFERHKLLFSFLMAIKVLQGDNRVDPVEWRFLISGQGPAAKGASGEATSRASKNPARDWITEQMWSEVLSLSQLPAFAGLDDTFGHPDALAAFREVFDSTDSHRSPLPEPWQTKLNPLQKMCVLRCLRRDKLMLAVQDFVIQTLGQAFVEPPPFDLAACYEDSSVTTPLIFVLSAGSDPTRAFYSFAEAAGMRSKVEGISLGQGQGVLAARLIEDAQVKGQWVLLQNCHLASSWMGDLERIVESIDPEKVSRDFRLWLTSMPSKTFPVSVLQNGVKLTNEPPKGLKANLRNFYYQLNDDALSQTSKPAAFRKLLFGLAFFHAVVQERKRFGPLGWNRPYDFNSSDLEISMRQLMLFLDEYEEIPYRVLHILVSYINYSGRITDALDIRTIDVILRDYFTPRILDEEYRFTPSGTYYSPTVDEDMPHKGYMDYIDQLPLNADPEVFGMHPNANITCETNEADEALDIIVSLQPRTGGGSGVSRDDVIASVARDISSKLPEEFDLEAVSMRFPVRKEESMNTVLVQECVRYNRLLSIMRRSLADIQKALTGLVVMSKDLDDMGSALHANKVPAMWEARSYPSLKPLAAWVADLLERLRFIGDWAAGAPPKVYWMSGFFFPQAFLTGTLQNYARKYRYPIDTLSFDFLYLSNRPAEGFTQPAEDGCYIRGLYLEGARFDQDTGKLADSIPKQLYSLLPVMHLLPVKDRKPRTKGIYRAPVYKILSRWGVLATTGHSSNFVLSIEMPTDKPTITNNVGEADCAYWIKAGVAAFCSLKF